MDLSGQLIRGTGSYEVKELSAQDSVLKHLDVGTKYLECTIAGTVAFPSDQAYGEWEMLLYKGTDLTVMFIDFISDNIDISISNGYLINISSDERIRLRRRISGTVATLFETDASYITINTWYKIKITRTLDGEFIVLILGGAYTEWTSVGSSTDITYTKSEYFIIDDDVSDAIAGLKTQKGVEQ